MGLSPTKEAAAIAVSVLVCQAEVVRSCGSDWVVAGVGFAVIVPQWPVLFVGAIVEVTEVTVATVVGASRRFVSILSEEGCVREGISVEVQEVSPFSLQ